jgi:hypothetical protein
VERALLSAAVDFELVLRITKIEAKSKIKNKNKIKIKSGGQECSPYTIQ